MIKLFIPDQMTTLNAYIDAERGHRQAGAKIKKFETRRTAACVNDAKHIRPVQHYPVTVRFRWIRKDRRTDPDNVSAATKFTLDGLVKAGILKDDGWDEIAEFSHEFALDKKNPGVDVVILEPDEAGLYRRVSDIVLSVYENATDHVVAYSPQDAERVWSETVGEPYDNDENDGLGAFERVADDTVISINFDDNVGLKIPEAGIYKKTAREWAEFYGRGFLCSEEW